MNADLDGIRTRARLLLVADKWRELTRVLENDIPMLIAEIEQLQQQLAAVKHSEPEAHVTPPQRDRARSLTA
jgi:hypothetical protein